MNNMEDDRRFLALATASAAISAAMSGMVSSQVTIASHVLNLVPQEEFTEAKDEVMTELRKVVQQMDEVYKAVAVLREKLEEIRDDKDEPS